MSNIYLDHNATTPVAPEVLEAMLPYLRGEYGNPSSVYALGQRAYSAMEQARAQVAGRIGPAQSEIVFTGGATEATNIAIRARRRGMRRAPISSRPTLSIQRRMRAAICWSGLAMP